MDLTGAHSRMVRDLYLVLERDVNRKKADPPEYDLQKTISDFYQEWLRNTSYFVKRECGGRLDVLIYKGENEHTFYEIKSYFKPNEIIRDPLLINDIHKLARKKLVSSEEGKAYLLIAGRKAKLSDPAIPSYVSEHANNKLQHFSLPTSTNVPGGMSLRLRPSRKQLFEGVSFVMTWEVLVDKQ